MGPRRDRSNMSRTHQTPTDPFRRD